MHNVMRQRRAALDRGKMLNERIWAAVELIEEIARRRTGLDRSTLRRIWTGIEPVEEIRGAVQNTKREVSVRHLSDQQDRDCPRTAGFFLSAGVFRAA